MLISGVKATHDGGVAVIDGNRLVFSVELEKVDNGRRYSPLGDLDRVTRILHTQGVNTSDVDRFVVDGWWSETGGPSSVIRTMATGSPIALPVAPYLNHIDYGDRPRRYHFTGHQFSDRGNGYSSFHHASNHLVGAFCASPFAQRGENSLVLVWDGAMTPWLYHVIFARGAVRPLGPMLPVLGNAFADFCANFHPFRSRDYRGSEDTVSECAMLHRLSIAGKAMAYAALGTVNEATFAVFDELLGSQATISRGDGFLLGERVAQQRDELFPGLSDADIIASFQAYLGNRLVDSVSVFVRRHFRDRPPNLTLGGGCFLNIKWNSILRRSGLFAEIWVPPFPNDSGAALGTACCEMYHEEGLRALEWNVYSGPSLVSSPAPPGWRMSVCDERGVAELLHFQGEPVVVLSGRAELGPRALGNRSILAPAVDPNMKEYRDILTTEGIMAGGSSGSAVVAIARLLPALSRPVRILTLLPDRGERYIDLIYADHPPQP